MAIQPPYGGGMVEDVCKSKEELMQEVQDLRRQLATLSHDKARLGTDQREVQDCTALSIADEQLAKIKSLLDESEALSQTGGWEMDLTTKRTFWTDNNYRLYGYEPGEILNHYPVFMRTIVHPEDAPKVRGYFRRALGGKIRVSMQYRIIRKDGEIRHLLGIAVPVKDDDGMVRRFFWGQQGYHRACPCRGRATQRHDQGRGRQSGQKPLSGQHES